jgi:hypothetical protein
MVREIVLGLVFMLTVFGSEARTGVELNEKTSVSTPAAKTTSPPQQESSRLSGVGKLAGLGEFKVALLWDNRVKVAMTTSDFEFERITSESGETEITVRGRGEDTLTIRFGGPDGLSVAKGERVIRVSRNADSSEAIRRLVGGRAITAFRQRVGQYERQLANETALRKPDPLDPYAYTFVLTTAFIGELAGDPNAIGRSGDLIKRRILAARGRPQQASFTMRQGENCWTTYEQALLANDTRNTQCMDATNSVAWYLQPAERLLCAAEFLSGALGAESSYIGCMGLAGLKLT